MRINSIAVDKFRTLDGFHLKDISMFHLVTGVNNSGKTNFLRVFDLFFNDKVDGQPYDKKRDLPYHMAWVTRSGKAQTSIKASVAFLKEEIDSWLKNQKNIKQYFEELNNEYIFTIKKKYGRPTETILIQADGTEVRVEPQSVESKICGYIFGRIKYFYMPSSIDTNRVISSWLIDEVLAISLDSFGQSGEYREKVEGVRESFQKFVEEIKSLLDESNKNLSSLLQEVLSKTPMIAGKIPLNEWRTKIEFPDNMSLLEAIKSQTSFRLEDGIKRMAIESKGSGLQKTCVILLIKYIMEKVRNAQRHHRKLFIWGIDEPELNMQPSLQKTIYSELKELAKSNQIILATHSPHFVDLYENPKQVSLFELDVEAVSLRDQNVFVKKTLVSSEEKDKGEFFAKVRSHLGLSIFDTWQIMKTNYLFEGQADKEALSATYNILTGRSIKGSILLGQGASKIPALVSLINSFAKEERDKVFVKIYLDNDLAGQEARKKITPKKYKHLKVSIVLSKSLYYNGSLSGRESELEDVMIPEIFWAAVCSWLEKEKNIKKGKLPTFDKFLKLRKKFKKQKMTDFLDFWLVSEMQGDLDQGLIKNDDVKTYIALQYSKLLQALSSEEKIKFLEKYPVLNELIEYFEPQRDII